MALINVPDIQNLDPATPESINSRLGTIVNEINGNLDNNNLRAGGVTASSLATDSVTTGKIVDAAVTPAKRTEPYKFSAYRATAFTAGSPSRVDLDTELFDTSNNFDPTTNHRFVAPVDGFYVFFGAVSMTLGGTSIIQALIYKNGALEKAGLEVGNGSSVGTTVTGPVVAFSQLVAGDYIELWSYGAGAAGVTGKEMTWLSGFLFTET